MPTKVKYKNEFSALGNAPSAASYGGYFFTVDGDDNPYVNILSGENDNTFYAIFSEDEYLGEFHIQCSPDTPSNTEVQFKGRTQQFDK